MAFRGHGALFFVLTLKAKMSKKPKEQGFFWVSEVKLSDSGGRKVVNVQMLREGEWHLPNAPGGLLKVDKVLLNELATNMNNGVRGKELPTDNDHQDSENYTISKGWIQKSWVGPDPDHAGALALFGEIEPTPETLSRIENKEIKYFSPHIMFDWENPADQKRYNCLKGGAWTNVPIAKGMQPAQVINMSEFDGSNKQTPPPSSGAPSNQGGSQNQKPGIGETIADTGSGYPPISTAQDPDAADPQLPDQCRKCQLLFDASCPFQGIEVKMAAAGEGNCPQFVDVQALVASDRTPGAKQPGNGPTGQSYLSEKNNMTPEEKAAADAEALRKKAETDAAAALDLKLSEMQTDWTAKLSEIKKDNETLLRQNAELQATNQRREEQVWLSEQARTMGRIKPLQVKLLSQIFEMERGAQITREVTLSEGGKQVVKEIPLSTNMLLRELIESLPKSRSVRLSETEELEETDEFGDPLTDEEIDRRENGVSMSEGTMEKAAKDLAKAANGSERGWEGYMGEAYRVLARKSYQQRGGR